MMLNDENVPVPSVYNKENKAYGKETTYTIAPVILWDSSRVWKILTAYVYTGAMVLGKTKTLISGKSIVRTVPKGQQFITEGTHEAIVGREEFEKAQLVIKSNSHKVLMGGVDFPLKGKVRCGNCRRVMAHNFKQAVPTFWCREAQYEFSSTLVISAECSCAIQCNADYFKEMYEKQVPEDKADEVYPLLFSTMRIDDIFVRYLMQYEILLGQVTNEHTQKEVTDYIKKVYNPANKDRQIGFQLTRRPRRKYKEDDLTYNRNLLGHGDIEKAVSEEKIRQLSRSIMDVLWFSLWNKAE